MYIKQESKGNINSLVTSGVTLNKLKVSVYFIVCSGTPWFRHFALARVLYILINKYQDYCTVCTFYAQYAGKIAPFSHCNDLKLINNIIVNNDCNGSSHILYLSQLTNHKTYYGSLCS